MKLQPLLFAALLPLCACACQTVGTNTDGSPESLSQFTVADLKAADADAVANGDEIAHQCYPALEQFIGSLPSSNASTTVVGAFSAFQKARDVRNAVAGGVPQYLTIGCGPLYAQVHGDILAFLALVAPKP